MCRPWFSRPRGVSNQPVSDSAFAGAASASDAATMTKTREKRCAVGVQLMPARDPQRQCQVLVLGY